jgi:osmotically-inducible protein OsmY
LGRTDRPRYTHTIFRIMDQDQALCERVSTALRRDPYLARRNLRFESLDGTIRLSGVVQSYYQKQMAQEVVRRIDGVALVENALEVAAL